MMYKLVKEYERFNLWINTRNGCHECFWKEIDPNMKSRKRVITMDEIYSGSLAGKLICCEEYRGFRYYIITLGTHPCAYISIHPGNDLYGVNYTYINGIACHGGLTYADDFLLINMIKLKGWFIGWDYAQGGDFINCISFSDDIGKKKWTKDEIEMECRNVIDQIIRGDYEIWKD